LPSRVVFPGTVFLLTVPASDHGATFAFFICDSEVKTPVASTRRGYGKVIVCYDIKVARKLIGTIVCETSVAIIASP